MKSSLNAILIMIEFLMMYIGWKTEHPFFGCDHKQVIYVTFNKIC